MKILILALSIVTSVFAQNQTVELLPSADTYVTSESSNQNFGDSSVLDLKTYYAGTRLLVKFNEIEIKSLLEENDLVSARIDLPLKNHYVHQEGSIGLHKMTQAWTEAGATWNCPDQPCATTWLMWSHDPNNTTPYPYELSPFSSGTIVPDQETPVNFDVTGYISDLNNEAFTNHGMAIFKTSTNINSPVSFYSKESDINPKLILTLKPKVVAPVSLEAKLTVNNTTGVVPLLVHFDASESVVEAGRTIAKYELSFGDGSNVELDRNNPVIDHTFSTEGDFLATLKITDSEGDVAQSAVSIASFGVDGSQLDNNYGYWINLDEGLKVDFNSGDKAQIQGDICKVWKTQNKSGRCHWVDKQKLHVRAFFPDMTTEVSGLVDIQTVSNRRNFSYETPELTSNGLNTFTVMVGEVDTDSMSLLTLTSKLEIRVNLLDQKMIELRASGVDEAIIAVLEKTRLDIINLISKIEKRNARVPSMLAQYDMPLKVDNKVSSARYYSTMVGGFRVEFLSDIGNLIEGDFAKVKTRVTNMSYETNIHNDHEGYLFKYSYKGAPLTTITEGTFNKSAVHEYTLQDSSHSSVSDLHSFDLEIEEKFKWWGRKVASSSFFVPVISDSVTPEFLNRKTEIQYAQNFPNILEVVKDGFGKISPSTFQAVLSGQMQGNIADKFKLETADKGASYEISSNLSEDYNEEGLYSLALSIKDFSQKETAPYTIQYRVDRTQPGVILGKADNTLNDTASFDLPVDVTDESPVEVVVFQNDNEINRTDTYSSITPIILAEGINTIKVEVTDVVGNKTISNLTATLDTTPPSISMANLSENFVEDGSFMLSGTIAEVNFDRYEVYLNDSLIITKTSTEILDTISLGVGQHRIKVKAYDKVGLTSESEDIIVNVDNIAPLVTILSDNNTATNNSLYDLELSIVEENFDRVDLKRNGEFLMSSADPSGASFSLVEGVNTIEVIAVDKAGNLSQAETLSVTLDTIGPVLSNFSPANDSTLRTTMHNLMAISNERLQALTINGTEADVSTDGMSFSVPRVEQGEGDVSLNIVVQDMVGNISNYVLNYEVFLKLIRIDLVTLVGHNGKIQVIGQEGAALENLPIDISGGFFNSKTITVNNDGSFYGELDFASSVSIEAQDDRLGLDEAYSIAYKADTTLAGMVKDVNNTPIPGATITLVSTGQSTVTDSSGVFNIPDPATGDQRIIIDASTAPEEFTLGTRKYSSLAINYSIGLRERNVIERVIYVAPILLDGTETEIVADQSASVTSPHAPGVRLDIPANAANFPAQAPQVINMMEIPLDKTSIEIFDGARPDTVYALEPSGLTFKEPVKLTLPNVNEFAEGTKLVIMSKNSSTGLWEINGAAEVVGNQVETTDGDGITHFSEVFAAPYGLDVTPMVGDESITPGFNTAKGSLTTQVRLPSYKTFGENFTPNFIYKSSWANPNVIISNVFNLSNYSIERDKDRQGGFLANASANTTTEVWTTPEHIKSKFYIADIESEELSFNTDKAPKTGIVSYAMDLDTLNSDNYFARSTYEIKYKHFVKITSRVRTRGLTGRKTSWHRDDQTLFDTVFPPDLQSRVLVQNKKDSEYGQGWKLGLTQEILNPNSDKIIIEETDGEISNYILDNSIETLVYEEDGIKSLSNSYQGAVRYSLNDSTQKEINLSDGISQVVSTFNKDNVSIGANAIWRWKRETKGGWNRYYKYHLRCFRNKYDFSLDKEVTALAFSDTLAVLDNRGALYSGESAANHVAGNLQAPPTFDDQRSTSSAYGRLNSFCNNLVDQNCDGDSIALNQYGGSSSNQDSRAWKPTHSYCNPGPFQYSSGLLPKVGYASGSLAEATFNKPEDMAVSSINGGVYYVADTGNNLVRKVSIGSSEVYNLAGNMGTIDPTDSASGVDASTVSIFHPRGIAVDSLDRVYISSENGLIRRVDPSGQIYTIAGGNRQAAPVEKNTIDKVNLRNPSGMVLDEENGLIYVADTENHRVVRLNLSTNESTQVAGNNFCQSGIEHVRDGEPALSVSICNPKKLALDQNKNLLILDSANSRIRRVNFNSLSSGRKLYKSLARDNSTLYQNTDGTFERTYRDTSKVVFNAYGEQTNSFDKNNNQFDFNYNQDGLLTQIIDYSGRRSVLTYSSGLLDTYTDPAGRMTVFLYDGRRLSEVRYSDGSTRRFTYNDRGNITEEFNQNGARQAYEYNEWNRLSKVISPDFAENVVGETITDSLMNDLGDQGEIKNYNDDESSQNELGKVFSDAKGVETFVSEDFEGFVTKVTDGEGKETNLERDYLGRPVKVIKNDGSYTTFKYSEKGDLVEKYNSSIDRDEKYFYNEYGYPTLVKDVTQKTKSFTYDMNGNLLTETDYNNQITTNTYYSDGLVKSITNNSNETANFEYDKDGNLIRRISPMGEVTSYMRDESGNIIRKIDPNSVSTHYGYDVFNRLTRVETGVTDTNPVGDITSYSYDLNGNLILIVDPFGNQTRFEYDLNDRLIKKTTPLNQITSLSYDIKGNLEREVDPNGTIKTFTYDLMDRLIEKALPDNVYQMSYDSNENVTSISDNDSIINYTYDKIGDEYYVTSETSQNGSMSSKTISYEFNDEGVKTQAITPYGDFTYSYDTGNRLTGLINHKGESFGFGYDSANRLRQILRPGSKTVLGVDESGFLTTIDHMKGVDPISQFIYTRDALGNRTAINTSFGSKSYTYDNHNQLKTVSNSEASSEYLNEVFDYDKLGNRINSSFGGSSFDPKKQRLMEDHKYVYAYDNNGNMTIQQEKGLSGTFKNFTYSSENQLIKVEEYSSNLLIKTSNYLYDALGRRYKKDIINHQNSSKSFARKYHYDGQEILAEYDELDSLLGVYTHSGLRADDVLAVDIRDTKLAVNTQSYFYLKDALGSITEIADASGNIIQHYTYSSFGKLLRIIDSSLNDITMSPVLKTSYGFTNREHDIETGMMYYRARYMMPEIGRFVQEDPHPGQVTLPSSFNTKYVYTGNNPIQLVDPSGLFFKAIEKSFRDIGREIGKGVGTFYERNKVIINTTAVVVASVVIAYASAGLGPVALSAAISGGVAASLSAANGGDLSSILNSYVGGAAAGAIASGFALSAIGLTAGGAGTLAGIGAGALGGAVGGFIGANVNAQITRGEWAGGQEAAIGIFAGAVGGGVAGAITSGSLGGGAASSVNDINRAATTSASSPPIGGSSGGGSSSCTWCKL